MDSYPDGTTSTGAADHLLDRRTLSRRTWPPSGAYITHANEEHRRWSITALCPCGLYGHSGPRGPCIIRKGRDADSLSVTVVVSPSLYQWATASPLPHRLQPCCS